MLKLFATICLSIAMLSGYYPKENNNANADVATCYGNTPCNACSNCSLCKYCGKGGTCGKCEKKEQIFKSKTPEPVTAQCKAVTKKGTRCKRAAGSGGYCWQHGWVMKLYGIPLSINVVLYKNVRKYKSCASCYRACIPIQKLKKKALICIIKTLSWTNC